MVELRTERLLLRPARPSDLAPLHAILGNADAMAYWSTPPHRHLDDAASQPGRQPGRGEALGTGDEDPAPEPPAAVDDDMAALDRGETQRPHPSDARLQEEDGIDEPVDPPLPCLGRASGHVRASVSSSSHPRGPAVPAARALPFHDRKRKGSSSPGSAATTTS